MYRLSRNSFVEVVRHVVVGGDAQHVVLLHLGVDDQRAQRLDRPAAMRIQSVPRGMSRVTTCQAYSGSSGSRRADECSAERRRRRRRPGASGGNRAYRSMAGHRGEWLTRRRRETSAATGKYHCRAPTQDSERQGCGRQVACEIRCRADALAAWRRHRSDRGRSYGVTQERARQPSWKAARPIR